MGLIVQKFGGTSVANADRIRNVAQIIADTYRQGNQVVAVLSAQGDTTDDLIEKAKEIYTGMGKVAVVCKKEIYGFIVNRLSWAALDSAKECVRDGVCSVEDMDKAIMFGPGMRMAVTGQLLTISLGVEGGFRAIADKYGEESTPWNEVYAQGVDEEIANRDPSIGNTVDSVCKFRDYAFAELLKLHKLL